MSSQSLRVCPRRRWSHQSLHDVIKEVVALYRGAHKDVELIVELDEDLPSLNFDREQLKRVMVNLLRQRDSGDGSKGTGMGDDQV